MESSWGVALSIIAIGLSLLIFKLKRQRYTKEGIPIIGNLPWIGCGVSFNERGGHFLKDVWKKYGNIFQIYVGGKSFTFAMDESFMSTFYKSPEQEISFFDGVFDKDSSFQLESVLGKVEESREEQDELITLKPVRIFLQENNNYLTERFIHPNFQILFDFSLKEQKLDQNSDKFSLEIFQLMTNLASGFGANLLAGEEVGNNPLFLSNLAKFQKFGLNSITKPPLFNKSDIKTASETRAILTSILKKSLIDQKSSDFGHSLLNITYQSTGRSYLLEDAAQTLFSYIFATIANTNAAMTHTLVEILTNPLIRQKIENEIREAIANHPDNINEHNPDNYVYTQAMIDKLQYLGYCITEALRFYSPPIHVRKANIDVFAEDGRLLCPKGSIICVSPWIRFVFHIFLV